ncbi:MAG: hypothetical protein H7Y42_05440 [Chitinophagaceae bacterium]|nr:hypothetical protein [Chitinophagaceae bacterium]
MKFLAATILSALMAFLLGLWLPWWSIAIAGFLIALLVHQRAGKAFLSGFLGIFLLWGIIAWWIDIKNEGILSHRIAGVLPLGGNSFLLIFVTALIGALVGGLGALSGSYLRSSPPTRK